MSKIVSGWDFTMYVTLVVCSKIPSITINTKSHISFCIDVFHFLSFRVVSLSLTFSFFFNFVFLGYKLYFQVGVWIVLPLLFYQSLALSKCLFRLNLLSFLFLTFFIRLGVPGHSTFDSKFVYTLTLESSSPLSFTPSFYKLLYQF